MFYNVSWLCFTATIHWRGIKKSVAIFFRRFSDEENKKKSKQIGQEKVALTITGAGVVARKLTFSISQTTSASCWTAPRQRLDGFSITSLSQVMSLACRVHWSWADCAGDTVKQSQRRVTSPTSKTFEFRQHLKCSLTAPRRAGTSFGFFFFVSFHSASCLSLGDLVQRCLGQPVDVLAPWPSAAVICIPRRRSTAVHFQSVERRVQRNLEGLANVRFDPDELPGCRAATLTFFFFFLMLTRRRGLGERGDKILRWRHSNCTH